MPTRDDASASTGRPFQVAAHHVEHAADTHSEDSQFLFMGVEPFFLLRHAEAGKKKFGAALFDIFYDFLFFFCIEVAVMASHEGKTAVVFHEFLAAFAATPGFPPRK